MPRQSDKDQDSVPGLACALLLTACNRQPAAPPAPPPEVATITVAPRPVTLTTELPGRTSPYRIAEIRPQVNGLIQKRLFQEGSDVQAGQVLYQINPAPFQAALDNAAAAPGRAEANLPAVRSRLERYQQGRWENALFKTYALSLTFFETHPQELSRQNRPSQHLGRRRC